MGNYKWAYFNANSLMIEHEDVVITKDDIAVLRTIAPRKSILNFSSEELALTSIWKKRFALDLKEKSPYYRAKYGEWRNGEGTKIPIIVVNDSQKDFVSVRNDIKSKVILRGTVLNNDTNWNICISRKGLEDTVKYGFKHRNDNVYSILYCLKDVITHSILLDSSVSEQNNNNKAQNTAFMHKFYSICKLAEELLLVKTTVEEFWDGKEGTLRRMYNVQDIKTEPIRRIEFTDNQLARSVLNDSMISVAELFNIVKTCDSNFYVNKVLTRKNEDEPFSLDDDVAAMVRKTLCSYCYPAEDGTYTMEYFADPEGKADITLFAGKEGLQLNVELSDGRSGLITTAARYCPYCGRKFKSEVK